MDDDRRRRRVRRIAGLTTSAIGVVDLVSATTPPARDRLQVLRALIPLQGSQTAYAAVGAIGIGLLLLGRGVRRGQRHAWGLALALAMLSAALHLVKGFDVEEAAVSLLVVAYLLRHRAAFTAPSDRSSISRALSTLVVGGAAAVAAGTVSALWIPRTTHLAVSTALTAVAERLVWVDSIPIPGRRDRFLAPALGGIGLMLGCAAGWLVFRPLVRRIRPGAAPDRARALVAAHGGDTLSYFALRDDKEHWIGHDTLVAFAIVNGVCLVSPDPIGPAERREEAWRAFRSFADANGWPVAVMGASEGWLPTYRSGGMRDLYIGDEAVVDVRTFSLDGGAKKGLRQAVNRIAKYGYTISFHDPAHLEPELASSLRALMRESRRGEVERGFSMTLGRIFDPQDDGLLLALCTGPDGAPAAFCQYVPAPGIDGWSLDLMRRSEGAHPNGLSDFVVVKTIEHLRERSQVGLGLNFAVMRSVLAQEVAQLGAAKRIQRKVLGWLSDSMQIESLWRYNAKFDPSWVPRYAAYDSIETFLAAAIAVAKAESFWELPVIGRFLAPARSGADVPVDEPLPV